MRELLGGKGANLAEMTSLGMPVPRGFTITTEACTQYYEDGRTINVAFFSFARRSAFSFAIFPSGSLVPEIATEIFPFASTL